MATKYVYFFGKGKAEGKASMKELLGGKGANLAEMSSIGVPVPAGFTISTTVCEYYYSHGKKKPSTLDKEIDKNKDLKITIVPNGRLVKYKIKERIPCPGP